MLTNSLGVIKISNDVLAKLAGHAASSCYGVVGMVSRSSKDGIAKLLKMESMSKGVKVKLIEDAMAIDIYIMVEYGINIGTIAESIKENVKYHVELASGLIVSEINVYVESVRVN